MSLVNLQKGLSYQEEVRDLNRLSCENRMSLRVHLTVLAIVSVGNPGLIWKSVNDLLAYVHERGEREVRTRSANGKGGREV